MSDHRINRERAVRFVCERPHAGVSGIPLLRDGRMLPGHSGYRQCPQCGAWYWCAVEIGEGRQPFIITKVSANPPTVTVPVLVDKQG